MQCKFCSKLCKNDNSLRNHERLCHSNPNRQVLKSNFIEYHKKLKLGIVNKQATNQFTKAKLEGKSWVVSDSTREKLSKTGTGKRHSVETKEKLSKRRSLILEEVGGGGFTTIRWHKLKNINGEEFVLRGSWELAVGNWLNENNIVWVRKVYLTYNSNGIKKTYCPDFYIEQYNVYLEVKGYFSQVDKEKLKAVVLDNNISLKLILADEVKRIQNNTFSVAELLSISDYVGTVRPLAQR